MNRRSIVVMLFGVLLAGLVWVSCGGRGGGNALSVSGNIELTEVKVAFKIPGKLIELGAEEGGLVKKGMALGRLDTLQTRRQREREEAGLTAAQSQLAQLRTAIEFQKATLAAELDLRRAEVKQAEARLHELLAGSRSQEIEQAKAAVEAARTQQVQAAADWERAQILFRDDDISRSQFDQFKARYEGDAAALKQAEERLKLVMEGPRKEEIEAARALVERAAASVKLSEAARLEVTRKEQELAARRAEVERAGAQIAVLDAQLADAAALSPIDGVVLVKSAEVGEVLGAGTAFLTIGDIGSPWLRAYINEKDLGRVKLGARATVTTDSFPGKAYGGRVSFISSEAEFTPKQIQTQEERVKLVYRIKIDIQNPQHELKSNMPGDAVISIDE